MMSNRHRVTPTDGWYDLPTDRSQAQRSQVSQRKLEELQRQIDHMKSGHHERENLLRKLDILQKKEKEKKEIQEKVMGRNSPRVLYSEMERIYGDVSPLVDRNVTPDQERRLVENVIQQRTKEFSLKQQEAAIQAKYLDKERRRLQEARQHVEEQRKALLNTMTPDGSRGPSRERPVPEIGRDVQGVDSLIKTTVDKMPDTMNKIWQMREDLQNHYDYYRKPYNGELGPQSYEPWQIDDFLMCRDIVKDVVEDFLNLYFDHDDILEKGTYKAMLEEDKIWKVRQTEALAEKKAVQLMAEGMMLDVTGNMLSGVIKEMYHTYGTFRNMTDTMLMVEAETVSTGKDVERDPSEKAYNMVTKAYFTAKENRNSHKKEVWGHSQFAQNKVKKRQITRKAGKDVVEEVDEDEEEEEEDFDAPDMTVIDFNTVSPVQLRLTEPSLLDPPELRQDKEAFQRYLRREIQYWGKISSKIATLTFDKKLRGIRLVQTSPNHRFLAAGSFHGDIIIYDVLMMPWRPVRCIHYPSKTPNPQIELSWSLDSSRIIAINSLGYLQVLSTVGGPVGQTDGLKLGLPKDDKGTAPHQLQQLIDLDVERHDFVFQQGILAEENAQDDPGLLPQKAAFFPTITFLGTQNEMMVSLDSGDILKCNFETALQTASEEQGEEDATEAPKIYKPSLVKLEEAANLNAIGQNVEAELFKAHKTSIIFMCFVNHLNVMITVDKRGFINKWKYISKFKSTFGWYIPARKYKIETSKIMYKESETDKPKVLFTDRVAPGKKPKTRQQVAAERRRWQNTLDNMQLGDPWHEEYLEEEDMMMQVYAPRGKIAESGGMFHIVYKHYDTKQLSTYITRLYKPVNVKCVRIVRVVGSPTSTDLIFILQFAGYPPKGPHFTIFIVDLLTMELRDYRKDIPLTEIEYNLNLKRTIISCEASRVFGPTGSDYLFIIFNGILRCISLTSGQPVAKVGQPKDTRKKDVYEEEDEEDEEEDEEEEEEEEGYGAEFGGCVIDETVLKVPVDSECSAVCFEGKIHCVVFARKMAKMFVVTFVDGNTYSDRRAMWKTYTSLQNHRLVPLELRVNTFEWDLGDVQHPAVAARKMLLKKIDTEMRKAGLIRDHPKVIRRIALSDKVENYKALEKVVNDSDILEKDGMLAKRAPSRMSTASPVVPDDDRF